MSACVLSAIYSARIGKQILMMIMNLNSDQHNPRKRAHPFPICNSRHYCVPQQAALVFVLFCRGGAIVRSETVPPGSARPPPRIRADLKRTAPPPLMRNPKQSDTFTEARITDMAGETVREPDDQPLAKRCVVTPIVHPHLKSLTTQDSSPLQRSEAINFAICLQARRFRQFLPCWPQSCR